MLQFYIQLRADFVVYKRCLELHKDSNVSSELTPFCAGSEVEIRLWPSLRHHDAGMLLASLVYQRTISSGPEVWAAAACPWKLKLSVYLRQQSSSRWSYLVSQLTAQKGLLTSQRRLQTPTQPHIHLAPNHKRPAHHHCQSDHRAPRKLRRYICQIPQR